MSLVTLVPATRVPPRYEPTVCYPTTTRQEEEDLLLSTQLEESDAVPGTIAHLFRQHETQWQKRQERAELVSRTAGQTADGATGRPVADVDSNSQSELVTFAAVGCEQLSTLRKQLSTLNDIAGYEVVATTRAPSGLCNRIGLVSTYPWIVFYLVGLVIARRERSESQASTVMPLLAKAAFFIHVLSWLFCDHWAQPLILILKLMMEPAMFLLFLSMALSFLPRVGLVRMAWQGFPYFGRDGTPKLEANCTVSTKKDLIFIYYSTLQF
ncbi:hypothetical protein B0T26DRAFT_671462 [Lasiosphaeria miniovina]|uniref:Transmembrane protein n=1 Tax=Lasiosphaeria miniovina TaxID=1954250 RepID=A0AA40E8V5_9PEZI|nr:uncharacterized protein B0T26DRAFT_671462 [Lasiosphaeria miniovina]KAK0726693.1 hypothetical protein B0T26DRAFT_671462 [Lasiosphaeria miniovina]